MWRRTAKRFAIGALMVAIVGLWIAMLIGGLLALTVIAIALIMARTVRRTAMLRPAGGNHRS